VFAELSDIMTSVDGGRPDAGQLLAAKAAELGPDVR
jgi:hypothetical protein